MTYLSVCSGIEAATVAWDPLGFKPIGFAEIESFPCELLKQRYPSVKNYGDITQYQEAFTGDFFVINGRQHYIRRLTPLECERLQGFPDNYTQVKWNGKPKDQCPDSHRYKAIGNSMAVPVMRWIGERIKRIKGAKKKNEL